MKGEIMLISHLDAWVLPPLSNKLDFQNNLKGSVLDLWSWKWRKSSTRAWTIYTGHNMERCCSSAGGKRIPSLGLWYVRCSLYIPPDIQLIRLRFIWKGLLRCPTSTIQCWVIYYSAGTPYATRSLGKSSYCSSFYGILFLFRMFLLVIYITL